MKVVLRIQILMLSLSIAVFSACNSQNKSRDEGTNVQVEKEQISQKEPESNSYSVESINFEDFKAKYLNKETDTTYVINFWATWCAPCVKELPVFENLSSDLSKQKLEVILVSLDFPNKLESSLIPFLEKRKLQSKVIHLNDVDANKWIPQIDENWSGAIPATFVYNKDKTMFKEGSYDEKSCLQCDVKPFLSR